MNSVIQMLRLTKDPEVRYGGANNTAVARFSGAVNRRIKRDGDPDADFFNYIAFGKTAEFIEKYLRKGTKIVIEGELRNNNWTDKEGKTHYNDVIFVSAVEFAERKSDENNPSAESPSSDDFMHIPEGMDADLPFE